MFEPYDLKQQKLVINYTVYGKPNFGKPQEMWIGVRREWPDSNTFVYNSDGTNVRYTDWMTGQPDNWRGNEDCVHFKPNTHWNDIACYHHLYIYCEGLELPFEGKYNR